MDRAELERLDRTTLIAQAEALGVARANILTRPELMDELLVRTARKDDDSLPRARGVFGRARDLVAKVIEKGLHLPDAAERLRLVTVAAGQVAARVAPAVVPTVTLAEIYAAQGHRARAIETLRRVLELEPDHGAAQALLTSLVAAPATIPPAVPPPPPEPAEDEAEEVEESAQPKTVETPPSMALGASTSASPPASPAAPPPPSASPFLDDDPLPIRYDVDECVALAVDPTTLYVYWEVREATYAHLQQVRPEGTLCLRLLIITPSWDGPRGVTRDFDVDSMLAHRVVRDLPAGAVIRAAVGWRTGATFLSIAHAPPLETPPGAPSPIAAEQCVRWTARGFTPVTPLDRDYPSIARAMGHLVPRREEAYALSSAPIGSSELSAGIGAGPTGDVSPSAAPRGHAPSSEVMI